MWIFSISVFTAPSPYTIKYRTEETPHSKTFYSLKGLFTRIHIAELIRNQLNNKNNLGVSVKNINFDLMNLNYFLIRVSNET